MDLQVGLLSNLPRSGFECLELEELKVAGSVLKFLMIRMGAQEPRPHYSRNDSVPPIQHETLLMENANSATGEVSAILWNLQLVQLQPVLASARGQLTGLTGWNSWTLGNKGL